MLFIDKSKHIFAFGPNLKPAAEAENEDIVIFETLDALSNQITSEEQTLEVVDFSKVNPATGPLYVKGAKPGDALKVDILDIEVAEKGVIVTAPQAGVLGDKVKKPKTKVCKIKDGYVYFGDIRIPARPMIGVIGVASLEEIPCGEPGRHGGNMDTKLIRKGTTLYLPVFVEGGLLAIGDLHAVMGDGEICVSACEVPGKVTTRVSVLEGMAPPYPVLETEDSLYLLVSEENLWDAIKRATELGVKVLQKTLNLSWDEAYMLGSLLLDVEISQLVDPKKTVRVRIPKEYIPAKDVLRALSLE